MKTRTCRASALSTGASACPYDPEKIVGLLLVPAGQKLPATLDGSSLEEACHADKPGRVYPIVTFVEYSKNGGEPQVSAVGYGPNQVTDVSAWTDTWTLDKYNQSLAQSLSRCMNTEMAAYPFDKNNVIYGYDDGTDVLAGFPVSSVYPTVTPYSTSSAKASMQISICHKDARMAIEHANFEQLDFAIAQFAYGLTPVKFVKTAATKYKIVEAIGGLDRTAEFGSTIASTPSAVLKGITTGVSYNEDEDVLVITGDTEPELKAPSALYTGGVKGIEQA